MRRWNTRNTRVIYTSTSSTSSTVRREKTWRLCDGKVFAGDCEVQGCCFRIDEAEILTRNALGEDKKRLCSDHKNKLAIDYWMKTDEADGNGIDCTFVGLGNFLSQFLAQYIHDS